MGAVPFPDLPALAKHLREELDKKKFVLLYAYNGVGKTRLSGAFRDLGRKVTEDGETTKRDTLYFNSYTEDLFSWDNDLEYEKKRLLELNTGSKFFNGLRELEMEVQIGKLLERYTDFNFYIDYDRRRPPDSSDEVGESLPPAVMFFREREENGDPIAIKVSRGEENIFIWCFFLAIVQLVLDGAEAYKWVKYVYIDDPISSLDEHNAIVVANHLVQLYRDAAKDEAGEFAAGKIKVGTIISTHHHLFFNVLHYELKNYFSGRASQYVLSRERASNRYELKQERGDTPSFHHVATLVELDKVARGKAIQTHHFNMLRAVLEKTALFHGYTHFGACIKKDPDDADGTLHQRFVDLLSHGKYSLYEPVEMGDETKKFFRKIVRDFLDRYPYNKALFPPDPIPETDPAS
ncbi:AAA family ATPase [Rhodanobacter sp. MP1X3]|uniref:AAA family ATPase n=1 Tax=Rhodanobacter sp. MP1X3 TaxID=2723086 RepID=UPI00160BC459|nr:AAA family ATPase [Rhodanobacter sp. MP1X3]MBB6244252.1 energy-coupling factor transporter ATP-binding protein EcfA2 [Rhodanobacter sp. MP1X3]